MHSGAKCRGNLSFQFQCFVQRLCGCLSSKIYTHIYIKYINYVSAYSEPLCKMTKMPVSLSLASLLPSSDFLYERLVLLWKTELTKSFFPTLKLTAIKKKRQTSLCPMISDWKLNKEGCPAINLKEAQSLF